MSKFFISSSLTTQAIQDIIDASQPWDTFVFESAHFTLDKTLYLKPEGRLYDGNGCILHGTDYPRIEVLTAPPAKRNLFQWIGYALLRLIGKQPRATGATITNFTVMP